MSPVEVRTLGQFVNLKKQWRIRGGGGGGGWGGGGGGISPPPK